MPKTKVALLIDAADPNGTSPFLHNVVIDSAKYGFSTAAEMMADPGFVEIARTETTEYLRANGLTDIRRRAQFTGRSSPLTE